MARNSSQFKFNVPKGILLLGMIVSVLMFFYCQSQTQLSQSYLILYALDIEGQDLIEKMSIQNEQKILGRQVTIGRLSGFDVILAKSGVSLTNAAMITQKLIDIYQPKGVIFTGIAGALDEEVHIGDIVICETWATHDYVHHWADEIHPYGIRVYSPQEDNIVRKFFFSVDSSLYETAGKIARDEISFKRIGDRTPKLIVGGVGVSGNAFVDNAEKRIWLNKNFNALITDRESSAVAQVCFVNGTPFIVFRSASDLAGGSGPSSARGELEEFSKIASTNSSMLVTKLLENLIH